MACPEGIRMGKNVIGRYGAFTVTTTVQLAIPANRDRIGLILFPDATTRITIGQDLSITATNSPSLAANGVPIRLHIDQDGVLVQKGVTAVVAAGTAVLGFIETLLQGEP